MNKSINQINYLLNIVKDIPVCNFVAMFLFHMKNCKSVHKISDHN